MGIPLGVARGARLPGEAWTRRDWALAQAVEALDRNRCPGCNTPLWLAYDPRLERAWRVGPPTRCHPCTAITRKAKAYEESEAPEALRWAAEQMT